MQLRMQINFRENLLKLTMTIEERKLNKAITNDE